MKLKTAALVAVIGLALNLLLSLAGQLINVQLETGEDWEKWKSALRILYFAEPVLLNCSLLVLVVTLYRSARS
jgi:hypothetical protein